MVGEQGLEVGYLVAGGRFCPALAVLGWLCHEGAVRHWIGTAVVVDPGKLRAGGRKAHILLYLGPDGAGGADHSGRDDDQAADDQRNAPRSGGWDQQDGPADPSACQYGKRGKTRARHAGCDEQAAPPSGPVGLGIPVHPLQQVHLGYSLPERDERPQRTGRVVVFLAVVTIFQDLMRDRRALTNAPRWRPCRTVPEAIEDHARLSCASPRTGRGSAQAHSCHPAPTISSQRPTARPAQCAGSAVWRPRPERTGRWTTRLTAWHFRTSATRSNSAAATCASRPGIVRPSGFDLA